jgi:uncharacterized protein YecE (DUF72 family)
MSKRLTLTMIRIGTAGWSIPRDVAERFCGEGAHLARYARVMTCAEINSSFYRAHSQATYARWAAQTTEDFRFAVKIPQAITHENSLRRSREPLRTFLAEIRGLGERLGPLLLQLPPSLTFEARVVRRFFALLRAEHQGTVVCEPRHATWFTPSASALMHKFRIHRLAADPAPHPESREPAGWLDDVLYYRLHGSPRKYWSAYSIEYIDALTREFALMSSAREAWCIFDNTASGAAAANALQLLDRLRGR